MYALSPVFFHPPAAVSLSISDFLGKGEKIISSSCVQSACLVPRLGAKRREKSWTVRPFYSPAAASTQSREGLGIKKERGRSKEDLFTFSRQITTREREREGCALFFDIVMILFLFLLRQNISYPLFSVYGSGLCKWNG